MTIAGAIDRARARLPRRLAFSLRGLMALVAVLALAFAFEMQLRPRWRDFDRRALFHEQMASMDNEEAAYYQAIADKQTRLADHPGRISEDELIDRYLAHDTGRTGEAHVAALRKLHVQRLRETAEGYRDEAAKIRARADDHAAQARQLRRRWW